MVLYGLPCVPLPGPTIVPSTYQVVAKAGSDRNRSVKKEIRINKPAFIDERSGFKKEIWTQEALVFLGIGA